MSIPEALAAILEDSRKAGFLGPGPVQPHVAHALGFARVAGSVPGRVLDLGSGGGLPGLVLAHEWPDATFVLLDSNERRTEFLASAVEALGWGRRVWVLRQRAEEAGREPELRGSFDLVVSRSFGPPATTAECASPFLGVGGRLVVSEPPDEGKDRWPAEGLAMLGLGPAEISDGPPRLATFRQERACPEAYPRTVGRPAKRPLF